MTPACVDSPPDSTASRRRDQHEIPRRLLDAASPKIARIVALSAQIGATFRAVREDLLARVVLESAERDLRLDHISLR